jgi:nucleoprotein TPR
MTMKTRRKSKTSAAAAVELEPEAGSSQLTEDISPFDTFNITLPDDLDFDTLGTILPDVSLTSPSADAIILLYKAVLAQASQIEATQRELEDARAEAERKDIELDQALQDRESLTKDLDGSLEKVQAELNQVRQARDDIGTRARMHNMTSSNRSCLLCVAASHSALQAEIVNLSTSQSSSSSELDHIRRRVDDTEREKRDLIAVIDRLKQDAAQRDGVTAFIFALFIVHSIIPFQTKYRRCERTSRRHVKRTRHSRPKPGTFVPSKHPQR